MKLTVLAVVGALVACTSGAPAPVPHVVHEKREIHNKKWERRDIKLNRDAIIPMSIGLAQRNMDNAHEFLMDVSHPASPNYGKHWTMEKIKATFSPSPESVNSVNSWLTEAGIPSSRIKLSKSLGWVRLNATVEEAEMLLRTTYSIYTNSKTGQDHLACEEYSVPSHIKEHIDFITPTIQFDAIVKTEKKTRSLESVGLRIRPTPHIIPGINLAPQPQVVFNMTNCYKYTTPDCLRALYNFTNGTLALSSYGIVEYTPQAYLQTDLDIFYANLAGQIPTGTGPTADLIDGGVVQTDYQGFGYNGESNLDLQYAISLVYPQNITLYQVGDMVEGASFGNFIDAIDASYCTNGAGDDPVYDATYPDPYPYDGAYTGPAACGTFAPTSVISTSYGYNEADLPASYEIRQCNEYLKLGLAGTTILYSSGDYGVAGNGGECCVSPGCAGGELNGGSGGTFNPAFPSTCPYITSIGATQIKLNGDVTAASPEEACETVIYSGGGFSNVFPIPDYQAAAVSTYSTTNAPEYNSTQYNNTGLVRAFPDVSANGANYVVAIDGSLSLVYGTSASSPVFGSIITLINNERAAVGKSSVGFINPVIYENPEAFTDITSGGNQGCGTPGFTAVEGWDPVTGLGTPDYPKLLDVFLALD